jgi:hypothetical protein
MNNESFFGEHFYNLEETENQSNNINSFNGAPFFVDANKNTNNSVRHTHLDSSINQTFFSPQNINNLQMAIIDAVFKKSNGEFKIGRQSDKQLNIIMRSIYLQHSKNLPNNIEGQISDLNKHVLKFCVPNIYSEILQYNGYLKAISTNVVPLDRSINISSKGEKIKEFKSFF